jgi:hypothetical protein
MLSSSFLFVISLGVVAGQSAEFCDVRVIVRGVDGGLMNAVPVKAVGPGGDILLTTLSVRGVAELCDIGPKEFTIIVGQELCGQVSLSRLKTGWPRTLVLPVILQNCHGNTLRNGCILLMHVVGTKGEPLEGATLAVDGKPYPVERSDQHGRLRVGLKFDEDHRIDVFVDNSRRASATVPCASKEPDLEIRVVVK